MGVLLNIKKHLNISVNNEVEFVPLGVDCSVSHLLRKIKLRNTAYPFDWNITPFHSVINLLEEGEGQFLNEAHLTFLEPDYRLLFDEDNGDLIVSEDIITPVLCRKYEILFPHDFSVHGKQELESVALKYKKRFKRLFDLLASDKTVVFVIADRELNDWQQKQYRNGTGDNFRADFTGWETQLSNTIDKKWPDLDYRLLGLEELRKVSFSFRAWLREFILKLGRKCRFKK